MKAVDVISVHQNWFCGLLLLFKPIQVFALGFAAPANAAKI